MPIRAVLTALCVAGAGSLQPTSKPTNPDLYEEKKAQAEMKMKMKKMKDASASHRDGKLSPPDSKEVPKRVGNPGGRGGPPSAKSHIWQRVAFESCKHLAYGEKCGEFTTEHTEDFEKFKGAHDPANLTQLALAVATCWLPHAAAVTAGGMRARRRRGMT